MKNFLLQVSRAAQHEATFARRAAFVRKFSGSLANHHISRTTTPERATSFVDVPGISS
ncbi:MAG: hypothetical protein WCF57_08965 [Pyrinomonadaceae bacterium]